jgi:hypothetical protein
MTDRRARDRKILRAFVAVYCRGNHQPPDSALCPECADLLAYAVGRLAKCPLDPKPACKNCEVHCYRGDYRARIREVMRYSGIHFIKRGRLDWLLHYFLVDRRKSA